MTEKESFEQFKERIQVQYSHTYYDRKRRGISSIEWSLLQEDIDYRFVKQEHLDKYFVSTVWVGLNMSYLSKHPPHIFETMIFSEDEEENTKDSLHLYQKRCSSEQEALLIHEEAVTLIRKASLIETQTKLIRCLEEEIKMGLQSANPDQSA